MKIQLQPLPDDALLQRYVGGGGYTDCFATDCAGSISHEQFVEAFYTTAIFKLERLILKWAASRPSTDAEARQLADGSIEAFAAWTVEARDENQILLCDIQGHTRSWLMSIRQRTGGDIGTRLYFGTAVVPVRKDAQGTPKIGRAYSALLEFHKIYSRVLLQAARSRLVAQGRT